MPSQRLHNSVVAIDRALSQGDLDQAALALAGLQHSLPEIGPDALKSLQASIVQWREQVTGLRAEYAHELKCILRRRQNVDAYRDVGGSAR